MRERPIAGAVALMLLVGAAAAATLVLRAAPAAADEHASVGTYAGPLRFEAGEEGIIELGDGRRYLDTVELRFGPSDQLVLVNELGLDAYVAGVAEMPTRWPLEALKAQAVAARTYAWHSMRLGTFERRGLGYDICPTVDCQVFRGRSVVEDATTGVRWEQAVAETAGEVLVDDDGAPILARYFSTSGGQTVPNELIFPDSGSRPYLVGIEDPDDEVSPYHRWEVVFTREEFDDILGRGDNLSRAVPVAAAQRDGALEDPHAAIVVTGTDGTEVRVSAVDFRRFVSSVAPELYPDRFPSERADGTRPLPATLPSSRFTLQVGSDEVVVSGRGWGHGVGLGQYGAAGKASRGMDYDDILAEYYNGLRPARADDVPDRIRVGMDPPRPLTIRADQPMRILSGEDIVVERALGTWEVAQDGATLVLSGPPELGQEFVVSPTTLMPGLTQEGGVTVEAVVNKPAELRLEVHDDEGAEVLVSDLGTAEPGRHAATWTYQDRDGRDVADGTYQVALVGIDETDTAAGESVDVEVDRSGPVRDALADLPLPEPVRHLPSIVAALLAAAIVVLVTVAALRRRS